MRDIEVFVDYGKPKPTQIFHDAAMQGDDKQTLVSFFLLTASLPVPDTGQELAYRIDFNQTNGGYDPSETIEAEDVTFDEQSCKKIERYVEYKNTRFGGKLTATAVVSLIDSSTREIVRAISYPVILSVAPVQHDGEKVLANGLSALEKRVAALKSEASASAGYAEQMKIDAETAKTNAENAEANAENAKISANDAKTNAQNARDTAISARNDAIGAKNDASYYAGAAQGQAIEAATSATSAIAAAQEIEDLTVSAEGVDPDEPASVTKTGGEGEPYNLHFKIPKGDPGEDGSVLSVNGKTGAVTLTYSDVMAASPSGYYADAGLGAATAENLIDVHAQGIPREFLFDSAAGEASIAGNGTATILEIKGNNDIIDGVLYGFSGTGLKTVGFNLFDKSAATRGEYIDESGNEQPGASYAHSDYIRILPGKTYTRNKNGAAAYRSINYYYDENKNYLGHGTTATGGTGYWKNTAPNDAHFVRVNLLLSEIDEYCFSFSWSGYRDGDFEPYNARTLALPISTYFPTGMKKAGTVYDSLTTDKAVKRVGSVMLGDLTWSVNVGANNTFYATIPQEIGPSPALGGNVTLAGYAAKAWPFSADKQVCVYNGYATRAIHIRDNSFGTVEEFLAACGNLVINYELKDQTETTIDPPLNLNYQISDFGTETVVSTEETAPLSASIRYSMDFAREVANLPKNYVSAASMANFLTALGSVTGGTWNMTYNAETGEYDFTHEEA